GTHDILLYRDILEALLYAVADQGKLVGDPLQVRERLGATVWSQPPLARAQEEQPRLRNRLVHEPTGESRKFFSTLGNRRRDTGEHIVWVKPNFIDDNRVDNTSKISVWSMVPNSNGDSWKQVESFDVKYNQNR